MGGFGSFQKFCEVAPLPACNLFPDASASCSLKGVIISDNQVQDLGTILIDIVAIFSSSFLIRRANKRRAAVGRREMQIFLGTYLLVSFCDIFTTGRFLHVSNDLSKRALLGLTSIQLGFTTAMFWILLLLGLVEYQLLDDGTPLSLSLVVGSAAILFTGTTYIALDTAFSFTGHFQPNEHCVNVGLYILYLGFPLVCMVAFAILIAYLILEVLGVGIPLVFLGAILSFVVGQLFEFVINKQICQKTSGAIDGAMFQTLLSFVAMLFLYTLWTSITEDNWLTSITYDDFESAPASAPKPRAPVSLPVKIEQPTGLTLTAALSELNWYKQTFLDQVEDDIKHYVECSRKRDCTAIVAIGPSGSRRVYRISNDGWARRFITMVKHKDQLNPSDSSLPVYDGDGLDSYLSQPIMDRVGELHSQFLRDHGDVLGSHLVERLRNNPEVYRAFARQFAQSVRDAGEPLTNELYEALVHLVQHQLSSHVTDELGRQLGQALLHVGGDAAITSFTTAMAHAFHGAITKILIKYTSAFTLKSVFLAAGNIIGKTVLGAFLAHATAHLAAHGMGAIAAMPVYLVLLPIVTIFTAHEIDEFPGKLARKIAPDVRQVVAGDFESRNQSALELIFEDTFRDGAKQICEILLSESQMAEKAKAAAEDMLQAARQGAIQIYD